MPDPDLPPDAPLRHRLWFRLWRGWRKAMIGLVVLVAVAWWTRPGVDQHRAAAMSHIGDPAWLDGLPDEEKETLALHLGPDPEPYWVDWQVLSFGYYDRPWRFRSIGAFGYVWVLE